MGLEDGLSALGGAAQRRHLLLLVQARRGLIRDLLKPAPVRRDVYFLLLLLVLNVTSRIVDRLLDVGLAELLRQHIILKLHILKIHGKLVSQVLFVLPQFLLLVRQRVLYLPHPLFEIRARRDYRALHLDVHLGALGALILLLLLLIWA